ncbi:alpha/beta fold hydrolase [Shewanella dokdonensis]|uniref:Alpha/beta fold hydrolase n=1 Tax=Shewanella dokdonensis TaxID=712036 RepID=A0ABX8DEN4_9GAMM|nr:alpha/beta fold hydrolase [Shewanella dokdonensis]MCL1073045.1 alpha/beta fold hydrolase [Shewanella dokdonensis]QVK23053.1 alpha/beta fold hydrolase [Shewanella dokdonensis]
MFFSESGQGVPVVLIHGLFGDGDNLKALGHELEADYRVIRVDCPNHGRSEHLADMDYPTIAKMLLALLDQLQIKQAHLVGHSMGGKIAMATALIAPERVLSVVAADIAPVAYSNRHDKVFAAMQSLPLDAKDRRVALQHLLDHGVDEATAQFLLKSLRRNDVGFEWKLNLAGLIHSYPHIIGWFNPPSSAGYLTFDGPILLLHSADPAYVNASYREAIVQQFPQAESKAIEGTGHWLHAQKPTVFNRIVHDFIDKHVSGQ